MSDVHGAVGSKLAQSTQLPLGHGALFSTPAHRLLSYDKSIVAIGL